MGLRMVSGSHGYTLCCRAYVAALGFLISSSVAVPVFEVSHGHFRRYRLSKSSTNTIRAIHRPGFECGCITSEPQIKEEKSQDVHTSRDEHWSDFAASSNQQPTLSEWKYTRHFGVSASTPVCPYQGNNCLLYRHGCQLPATECSSTTTRNGLPCGTNGCTDRSVHTERWCVDWIGNEGKIRALRLIVTKSS
jgi:hypothetical protein